MPEPGLVVIGSGPAGIAAAIGYREAGGAGHVQVVSSDPDLPYDRPPLSKDLLQGATNAEDAQLHPGTFYAEHDIALLLATGASELDVNARTATLMNGRRLSFGSCVLATGSHPVRPPVPGTGLPIVHTLRSLQEGLALRSAAAGADRAVVVGSGFIGCEAAASLAKRGVAVTLVTDETQPQANRLGTAVAERIAGWLREQGVELVTEETLAEIVPGGPPQVRTESGGSFPADLVLLATGVAPNTELAVGAGLRMEANRVRVDSSMRTGIAHIFAAGDVALATNDAAGRPIAVEHWGEAMTMGEIAGRVAAGEESAWAQAPGFWSVIGDHTVKYAAWGDGFDDVRVRDGADGAFTAWYAQRGRIVGVLTYESDGDYDRGQTMVEDGASIDSID